MWIVKFGDNTRHSAWSSKKSAIKQVNVLIDKGYIRLERRVIVDDFIEYDSTVTCEDGHYYI